MKRKCKTYGLREHRRVGKFLAKHPQFIELYVELRDAVVKDPYRMGQRLRGRCRGLYKARKGELRIAYRITDCTVVVEAAGLRENFYEELC